MIVWWQSMSRAPITTFMIAWHCTMRTPLTTSSEREHAFPLVCQRSVVSHHSHTHGDSSPRCLRLSPHPHGHLHVRLSSPLILPFNFLLYLPPLFFFLLYLKVCGKHAQLRQREYGLHQRVFLSTSHEPKAHDFYETLREPNMQLLDLPPLFSHKVTSADPDHDDATLEDMFHQAHRAQAYNSPREDLTVSLSSSSMSERTGRPVDRGDPVSNETQKHRLRLWSLSTKKSKFLQSAKQELINTNFKQLEPKKINNFFKDNYCSKIWNYVQHIKEVSLKWES